MNTKLITILATLAILTAGCGKSPNANGNASQPPPPTPPPIQAEPFHGQVYKTLDGRSVLTLISKDECELAENGRILLFKYTKQNDALRMVSTELGTSQVIYLRFTDQGLVDNAGDVLLSPERYADKKIDLERETKIISTFSVSPILYTGINVNSIKFLTISPDELVLTDVSLKLQNRVIHFSQIKRIWSVEPFDDFYAFVVDYDWPKDSDTVLKIVFARKSEVDIENINTAVLNAYNAWKAKFPDAVAR